MKQLKFLLLLPLALQSVAAEEDTDGWQFQLTPYLWLPTISGQLNYDLPDSGGGAPRIDVGPTDWFELLNGAFLLQGEARKDRFFVFADVVYLGLESDNDEVVSVSLGTGSRIPVDSSVNLKTKTELDGFTLTLAGGYTVYDDKHSRMDLFAGGRYFGIDAKTSWSLSADIELPGGGGNALSRKGSVKSDLDSWDAITGIKGQQRVGNSKWSVPYYLDVGTGDSDLTWQAIAGASYGFGWGDLIISYRHFEYDGGPRGLLEDFGFSGPVIGGRFSF